jgi:hypothetical protein
MDANEKSFVHGTPTFAAMTSRENQELTAHDRGALKNLSRCN